jgi:hypothetical protein
VDDTRISGAPNCNRLHATAATYDWTKPLTVLAIGVVVALFAAALSGPIDPRFPDSLVRRRRLPGSRAVGGGGRLHFLK